MRILYGDSVDNIEIDRPTTIYEIRKLIQDLKNIPMAEIHIIKTELDEDIFYMNKDVVDNSRVLRVRRIKNRCPMCFQKSATIIGNCRYCLLNYCSVHRLPESHLCPHLADCKRQSFEKNSHTVLSGKCIAPKI